MNKIKLAVTTSSFSKNEFLRNSMIKFFPNTKFNSIGKIFSKQELIDFIQDCDGAIIGLDEIDNDILKECKKLKVVAKYGVGLNNINLEDCKKNDVHIGWSGGLNKVSVAEMTLSFMLMLSRNIYKTSNKLKNGIWDKSGGFQLSGKAVGIIGIGHIGKQLIDFLKPFNCKILVNDIINQDNYYQENNLIKSSKEEIYIKSDIITIHTPLDDSTKNLITIDTLKQMKKSSYLLNTARGGIVNEKDLKYALQNNIIAGAGMDVYTQEPPTDEEFLKLPNLICTPHIGGNSKEAIETMGMSAIKHLKEYFNK